MTYLVEDCNKMSKPILVGGK